MKNPFAKLQKEREDEEAKAERLKAAKRLKEEAAERIHQAQLKIADQYDEMVREVLELLRDAAYPDLKVCYEPRSYEWLTGKEKSMCAGRNEYITCWISSVTVRLLFAEEGHRPIGFEVIVPGRGLYKKRFLADNEWVTDDTRRCGPSEAGLVAALKALHKLGTR